MRFSKISNVKIFTNDYVLGVDGKVCVLAQLRCSCISIFVEQIFKNWKFLSFQNGQNQYIFQMVTAQLEK